MMYGADPIPGSELAMMLAADSDPETGILGDFVGWVAGADKKAARARKALVLARQADAEAAAAREEAERINTTTRRDLAMRKQAAALAREPAAVEPSLIDDLRSPSSFLPVPVPSWALALGVGAAVWALAPGRLAVPGAIAATVGVGLIDRSRKRKAGETGCGCER